MVGGDDVNCHMSQEVGMEGIKRIINTDFKNLKFKKKYKVVSLATVNSIRIGNTKVVPVDPLTLFQRLCLAKQSEEDLMQFFPYELAPYPTSIFYEEGM